MSGEKKKDKLFTLNFVLIFLINLLFYFAYQVFPPAMPPYVRSLGAPDQLLGWLTGLSAVATLAIRPLAGLALDRYGRKGIMLMGAAGMLVVSCGYFIFPYVGAIFALRFAHGLVWGVASTSSNTVASGSIPKSRFGEGMGLFSLSISLALATAPALSLAVDIRTVFAIGAACAAVAGVLTLFLRSGIAQAKSAPLQAEEANLKKRAAPFETAAAMPALAMFLITTTYGAITSFIALFGAQRNLAAVGMFFTVYAASMLITRPVAGKLIDRMGFGVGVWPSAVLLAAAMLLLSRSASMGSLLFSAVLYGLGYGAIQTSFQTLSVLASPANRVGAANATFFFGFDGGIGFGAVIGGVLSGLLGYGGMFAVLAVCPVLSSLVYLFGRRFSPVPGKQAADIL